ncbi:hypothetical protein C0Q70_21408 [Pomacea canaliculata]|uniref:EGF-like domain-containing protein n=1 Tax=Pomacea canaliculata TaxID=400727 RepID=A0A2T7NCF5_POMCA|nr:hypothetical protein C0Q70_21408 [Pomacea canaliculata]
MEPATWGHCVCNTGYTGDNCHLLEGQGPQLSRIRNSNACDVNERPCRKVFIDVTNIALTDQLKCRVQEVLTDGSLLPDMSVDDGDFLSAGRLACNLPDARVKSADFPVITAVSLSRSPSNHTLLVCDINSQVTAPTARYRLSWGVDGLWREEQEVDSGHLTASVTVSDLPNGVQLTTD